MGMCNLRLTNPYLLAMLPSVSNYRPRQTLPPMPIETDLLARLDALVAARRARSPGVFCSRAQLVRELLAQGVDRAERAHELSTPRPTQKTA